MNAGFSAKASARPCFRIPVIATNSQRDPSGYAARGSSDLHTYKPPERRCSAEVRVNAGPVSLEFEGERAGSARLGLHCLCLDFAGDRSLVEAANPDTRPGRHGESPVRPASEWAHCKRTSAQNPLWTDVTC